MSTLGSTGGGGGGNIGTPFLMELKKQASFFFKGKIRTARLALTDVTPAQLLAEEATNGNPWAPDTRTMGFISRTAFELDNYWRIVDVLHIRLARFDRKRWRESYKALILLEHLLTHGPASIAEEFQADTDAIKEFQSFQHVDERGFNWGLAVRKKSARVLQLLDKGAVLQEERDRARKLTRGIEGFGSFGRQTSSLEDASQLSPTVHLYGRSNSHYTGSTREGYPAEDDQKENSSSTARPVQVQFCKRTEAEHEPLKENGSPTSRMNEKKTGVSGGRIQLEESKPLLSCTRNGPEVDLQKDDSFSNVEHRTTECHCI